MQMRLISAPNLSCRTPARCQTLAVASGVDAADDLVTPRSGRGEMIIALPLSTTAVIELREQSGKHREFMFTLRKKAHQGGQYQDLVGSPDAWV